DVAAALSWITYNEVNDFHSPITTGFGLNKAGEQVLLSYLPGTDEDRIADTVRFKGQLNGRSLGRYADGETHWYELTPTSNTANALPTQDVLISEIMYHAPAGRTFDYVEIFNPTASPVDLWTVAGPWRIDGGIGYTFPSNTTLAANERLVIISFNPADNVKLTAFFNTYGLMPGDVRIFGRYEGELSNEGDRIALEKPQLPDGVGEGNSWIIVDEAIYFDQAPWPAAADGFGLSLVRGITDRSGNDPANWNTEFTATPGYAPQEIVITQPPYGATMLSPNAFTATVSIDSNQIVGSVHGVDLFLNGVLACSVAGAPWSCLVPGLTMAGTNLLQARYTDDAGSTTSRPAVLLLASVDNLGGASGPTPTTADLNGSISDNGTAAAAFFWGLTDGGSDPGAWSQRLDVGEQTGSFSGALQGLTASQTYYYRSYATNTFGDDIADTTESFQTAPARVSIRLAGPTLNENGGSLSVRADLNTVSASNVTVHLGFSGVAEFGIDYTATATTLVIAAGTGSGSIQLNGLDDSFWEEPEAFTVHIAGTVNAMLDGMSNASGAVISDDIDDLLDEWPNRMKIKVTGYTG
ncbi:MAG: lamin tail domain-containing protein, partial [Verrucomicrobiota bacterium]